MLDPNNKMYIHGRGLHILQNVGFSLDDGILEINNIKFAEWEKKVDQRMCQGPRVLAITYLEFCNCPTGKLPNSYTTL